MRVLGFDPGTATTGYGVIEADGNRLLHVAHGVVTTPANEPFETRLQTLYRECCGLLRRYTPDSVAVEQLFFTKNVTTGISVAQARGVIALSVAEAGLPIAEFSPREVKSAVAAHGGADKRQVQEMLKILLNLDAPPKPDDAADALGLAICQIHAGKFKAAAEG